MPNPLTPAPNTLAADLAAVRTAVQAFRALGALENALASATAAVQLKDEAEKRLAVLKEAIDKAVQGAQDLLAQEAATNERIRVSVEEARVKTRADSEAILTKASANAKEITEKLKATTAEHRAQVAALIQQAADLDIEVANLRTQRDALTNELAALKSRFSTLIR